MNVLVTGGGLVGAQVARLMQESGHTPVVFDLNPDRASLADHIDIDAAVIVQGDLLDLASVEKAVKDNEVRRIVHTAAFPGLTAGALANPIGNVQVNVLGTAHVLEAARRHDVERVVLCSSSAAYSVMGGKDNGQADAEDAYPRPSSIYAMSKKAAEDLGMVYAKSYGMEVIAVRFARVFGPLRRGGGGMATVEMEGYLRDALAGKPVEVEPSRREWIYCKDAAGSAHHACWADLSGFPDRVFNVGIGVADSGDDLAAALRSAVPDAAVTVRATGMPDTVPMSPHRTRTVLGFTPRYPLPAAFADYRQWIESTAS
ncbi:NAD(P)-dependent oxidoreductase [Streptosporangium sp. NPDC002544]|uniref:NAD-dependent epimerase/dehydratase family protein n=1 Tax=Streptosporangium sp. NPDC002544 TaxID=3154538 RepID=UPI003326D611